MQKCFVRLHCRSHLVDTYDQGNIETFYAALSVAVVAAAEVRETYEEVETVLVKAKIQDREVSFGAAVAAIASSLL